MSNKRRGRVQKIKVAFLSMELLRRDLPEPARGANYKGGLGILAGDIAAALSVVDVEAIVFHPLYLRPWFRKTHAIDYYDIPPKEWQVINAYGENHTVLVRASNYNGTDICGLECPGVFDVLYTEDRYKRLLQEVFFAHAVYRILKIRGWKPDIIWLNESHTALIIPLVREDAFFDETKILFTIHTPEPAGMERFHDYRFDRLGIPERYHSIFVKDGVLDFTWGAVLLADAVNAVSKEHRQITKEMFPQFRSKIHGIRNGTDAAFWTYPHLLENIHIIDRDLLMKIHAQAREEALTLIGRKTGIFLDRNKPTLWFVRRLAEYKKLYPILRDILPAVCGERGTVTATPFGPLEGLGMQIVGAGMASESDGACLWWMGEFNRIMREVFPEKFVFLPEYNLELLQAGAWGADIWLVSPEPKREACSTSDQRAQINGIPVVTTKTGGMTEYINEFDPQSGAGNGFFIEPYTSLGLYEKLRIFSNLWYAWKDKQDSHYPTLKYNILKIAYESLDVYDMLVLYYKLMRKIVA